MSILSTSLHATLPAICGAGSDSLLEDLFVWLNFDETSGRRFDSSINRRVFEDVNTVGYGTGKQGNAADFEYGNDEYFINISNDWDFSGQDFTLSVWLKPEDLVQHQCYFRNEHPTPGGQWQYYFGVVNTTDPTYPKEPYLIVKDSIGASQTLRHTKVLSLGTWYHFLVEYVHSTGVISLSIDGETPQTMALTGGLWTLSSLPIIGHIGQTKAGGDRSWDGLMDNFAIWTRVLTADEKARVPNTSYPGTPEAYHWTYASLAAAESSGDDWQDGDDINILGGALFVYQASLAVSGYSGLIHKYPWDGTGELGAVSVASEDTSTAAGSDPDTWSGWNDSGTITKGVEYDLDTTAGLSRYKQLHIDGQAALQSPALGTPANYAETFQIMDQMSHRTDYGSGVQHVSVNYSRCYVDASNTDFVGLNHRPDSSNTYWIIRHTSASYAVSTIPLTTSSRIFMYVKSNQWALWRDAESVPNLSGTVPRTSATAIPYITSRSEGRVGFSNVSDVTVGNQVLGYMTTS